MPETEEPGNDHKKTKDKKKWRSSLLFWLILYGLLVLIGLSIGSCYFINGADRAKFWVEGLLSAGVLSVVIVQAVIYRRQWRVMERQWRESHKMMELMARSECAYVTVSDWELPANVTNGLVVTAVFLNAGRTPALDLKRTIQVAVGEGHPPVGWGRIDWNAIPHDTTEGIVLAANRDVKLSSAPMEIPPSILAEINSGKQFIVVDGQCQYSDILGGVQIYEFGMTIELAPARAVIRYQKHTRKPEKRDEVN